MSFIEHLLRDESAPTIAKLIAPCGILMLALTSFILGRRTAGYTFRTAFQESIRIMLQFQMNVLETEMSWCNAVFDIEAEGRLRVGIQCDEMTEEDGHGMENIIEIDSSHEPGTFNKQ
ncbi:hypothetical protein TI39_contig350g00016 [Zymoseptoria brevis]|uniref:Uncharacterized protein n=1 Tax=Zymoseptoria brevis TaxID=1047168 RepID=A0A0F4GQU5_9PEZI|nr:hypothetical protein TI39_contig350g00016 [Zymoseptoria brevis]